MSKTSFSPNVDEFISNYEKLKSSRKMAELYKVEKTTILNFSKKIKYVNDDYKSFLDEEQVGYIIDNYNKATSTELSKKFNCSKSLILNIWRKNGLKGKDLCRRYYCDFNYFNSIKYENAYIIGLIASDGCIYKRDGHQGLWQISLNKEDKSILERISLTIKSEKPLQIVNNMCTISINSEQMYNDLKNVGLFDNKTYGLISKKLNIPQKYWMSYIRGYFDGDGSIFISIPKTNKNITPRCFNISISGFKENLFSISQMLEEFNIKSLLVDDKRNKNKQFSSLQIHGTTNKYLFLKLIYQDIDNNNLYLERKYLLARQFIQMVESNSTNRSENIKAIETIRGEGAYGSTGVR